MFDLYTHRNYAGTKFLLIKGNLVDRLSFAFRIVRGDNYFPLDWVGSEERISAAAIFHKGKVYTGKNHGAIMQGIWKTDKKANLRQSPQGFVTCSGKFVSRREAAKIAFKAGQIEKEVNSLDSYMLKLNDL